MTWAMFIPDDVRTMMDKYDAKEGGGPCGPACIAVIERRNINDVLKDWKVLFGEYQGWARWRELRQYLEHKRWNVKQRRFTGKINLADNGFAICRIQWEGPNPGKQAFAGWNHRIDATSHTHFAIHRCSKQQRLL